MRDFYADAFALGEKLAGAGALEWQTQIRDAIAAGSTSGEILMALRWELRQMLKADLGLPREIVSEAKDLIDGINRTGI